MFGRRGALTTSTIRQRLRLLTLFTPRRIGRSIPQQKFACPQREKVPGVLQGKGAAKLKSTIDRDAPRCKCKWGICRELVPKRVSIARICPIEASTAPRISPMLRSRTTRQRRRLALSRMPWRAWLGYPWRCGGRVAWPIDSRQAIAGHNRQPLALGRPCAPDVPNGNPARRRGRAGLHADPRSRTRRGIRGPGPGPSTRAEGGVSPSVDAKKGSGELLHRRGLRAARRRGEALRDAVTKA